MSSYYQALTTQISSLGLQQLFLPSRYHPNYFQPLNLDLGNPRRFHKQNQVAEHEHIDFRRRLLTVPYFKRHHEQTTRDKDIDGIDVDDEDEDDDYVVVEKKKKDQNTAKMVQLTEVPDEHFVERQAGPIDDDADYSDTESEISTDSEYDPSDETLAERLAALRDIVPPTTRGWISSKFASAANLGSSSLWFAGKALWVVSSTALLLGVPFAICVTEEQQVMAMEQEYKMREVGSEALTEGGSATADRVGAALGVEGKSAL
ncbi:related to mitochondrial receptor complex chain MOM22 [Cephalotrichum gorgonifer]|uniref:Related to mitochondrial receptor complex chain MOM22 n=1 Tax=Cephalotrichum gorgonifer TaxID=2041049 RepID=A0AAE8N0D5_9PEZI|nr:related to mitochondrial receptor complex chain MOM22 [Cephalotrichum gorgonifer]